MGGAVDFRNAVYLAVRLPAALAHLSSAIIAAAERDAVKPLR
jgi:hypothetical protein